MSEKRLEKQNNRDFDELLRDALLEDLKEEHFTTGLRDVIAMMKRSEDKEAMKAYCRENENRFQEMEEETDTEAVIRELVQKKRRGQGPMDEKEKHKLYGFLLRRGFSTSDILSVLREFSEDDEGNLT